MSQVWAKVKSMGASNWTRNSPAIEATPWPNSIRRMSQMWFPGSQVTLTVVPWVCSSGPSSGEAEELRASTFLNIPEKNGEPRATIEFPQHMVLVLYKATVRPYGTLVVDRRHISPGDMKPGQGVQLCRLEPDQFNERRGIVLIWVWCCPEMHVKTCWNTLTPR